VAAYTSAARPAAQSAVTPFSDPVDLVNTAAGEPAAETYPGALDPAVHSGDTDQNPTTPGGIAGPPYGSWQAQPFTATLPEQAPGGGYQQTSWQTGHDAPQAAWDSSAGAPFAPSGPLAPMLHAEDDGTVWRHEHVIPAAIGSLTRRTQQGQTTIRNGSGDQVLKDNVVSPNDRVNLDEYQVHRGDDSGWAPWEIPYAERAVTNNLAWEAQPVEATGSPYVPSGYLPDRSVYDYAAVAYEAPPDPSVTTAGPPAADTGIGGGWVL
jgi:hypothetical protein